MLIPAYVNPKAGSAQRALTGSQVVVLDPDVAAAFGDAKAVNRALRTLIEVVPRRPARSSRRRTA